MPVNPVPRVSEEDVFLRSCLVEGDSAQESRVRRNKRRALLISIGVQILILAALVLFPLFSKGENIANRAVFVPAVPYNPGRVHDNSRPVPQPRSGRHDPCRFCPPPVIPTIIVEHDVDPIGDPNAMGNDQIPGVPEGNAIPGLLNSGNSPHRPEPPVAPRPKERLHVSEPILTAMLTHRVDPLYPALAKQIRREGRVELHAIIATDGTVQSLEVLSGDPLFIQSALAAVREWRYRPTILDGQPIEVDTHITVIYTLNQ
jgi:periplasmic protein TonB